MLIKLEASFTRLLLSFGKILRNLIQNLGKYWLKYKYEGHSRSTDDYFIKIKKQHQKLAKNFIT